jgi:hypothetical protein
MNDVGVERRVTSKSEINNVWPKNESKVSEREKCFIG